MSLNPEWLRRVDHWRKELCHHFYTPLAHVSLQGFVTHQQLSLQDAQKHTLQSMPTGTAWGAKWEYGWFFGNFTLPSQAEGQRIVMHIDVGGESLVFINNSPAFFVEWTQVGGGTGLVLINGSPELPRDWHYTEVPLATKGTPGQTYELAVEAYAGHGPIHVGEGPVAYGTVLIPEPDPTQTAVGLTSVGIWNEVAYQLWLDVETLYQIRSYTNENTLRASEIDAALRTFTRIADFEIPPAEMTETFEEARHLLKPLLDCKNGSTAPTLYAIGHAHLDVAWLWPLAETERKIGRTISNQLALMAEYPDYKYIQTQPHLFTMLRRLYPELYTRAQTAVTSGQLIVEGGMWVEADTNLPSGESLIRQFIHGKRFFKEEFGVESELLWLPDVFGYSGSLPQIMKGCGIHYFATHKIFWTYNGGDPFPYNLFTWEGIDGSTVLAHIFNNYNSQTDPWNLNQRWTERVQKDDISSLVVSFGWGDAGGGPTRDHVEFLNRAKNLEGVPCARVASPVEFFHAAEKKGIPDARYVGELYYQGHRGTYTSQACAKKNNRRSELTLREAELWSVVAMAANGHAYPYAELDADWQTVLLLQFHDILPGCSIHRVYEEAETSYTKVLTSAQQLATHAQRSLAKKSCALTVFNSLSWERKALVDLPQGYTSAQDSVGNPLPTQAIAGKTLAEVPLPSCGWTTIELAKDEKPRKTQAGVKATKTSLENEYLKIELNSFGEIISIYDKDFQRVLTVGTCNSFKLFKDVPNWFDAWDIDSNYELAPLELIDKAALEIVTEGALVATLRMTRKIHNSLLQQDISLRQGSRQVVFNTTVDWQENHKLLKVAFPINVHANDAIHEIQFGHIRRPNHRSRPFDANRFEVSHHKWTALAEEDRGVALLNDSKYGVNVLGNSINLTLLRSPLAPDMTADRGIQVFSYAFYAWNGSFAHSGIVHEAYELNCPVTVTMGSTGTQSVFSVNAPNIIIEAVKAAEDRSGDVIVRLYESKHTATRCILTTTLFVNTAIETSMLEEYAGDLDLDGTGIPLEFRPFEVKTVRLKAVS